MKGIAYLLAFTGLCALFLPGCSKEKCIVDVLLSQCYVIDGTGADGYYADIYLKGDQILHIADTGTIMCAAIDTIHAAGYVVTPGFIDVHAHGDAVSTPEFENFLAMGVTTIVLGQDGVSPWVRELKSSIVNKDSLLTGVNIAYMAGHGTLRRGSGVYESEANTREIERLTELVEQVMEAGCFGVSTGLEYLPGSYAGDKELDGLAKAVGASNGIIMSHLRSEDDNQLEISLNELLKQGQYAQVHCAHLKSVYGSGEGRAEEILEIFENARSEGVEITADMYPYLASYTGIAIVFPPWAKTNEQFEYVKVSREKELRQHLYKRVMSRNGPGATLFGNPPFTGMTLEEVASESGKSFVDVLMMLGPESISAAYFVMDLKLQDRLFVSPFVMVGSDGSSAMHHPRGYGTFARVLRYYVFDQKLLSLGEAVRKMTDLPANTLHLNKRGRIEEGYYADINIIDTNKVRDLATFVQPHVMADGFVYSFINGKIARQENENRIVLNGRVLSSVD